MTMENPPFRSSSVIKASAACAVIALVLLVWQGVHSLGLIRPAAGMAQAGNQTYALSFVVAVACGGIVFVLLWAIVHTTRARTRAESLLQSMTHRPPGAFYTFRHTEDGLGMYEFLTVDACDLLGVSADQMIREAASAHRRVVPDDRERLHAAIALSRTTLSPLKEDVRIGKSDGEIRWIRMVAVPMRKSSGVVVWNGQLLDISETRSTEQALREANQRLEDAQSVAKLGDWTCDVTTGEVTLSRQAYQLLERDPALGSPSLAELVEMHLEGPEPMANAFELAQATNQPQSFEASIRLPGDNMVTLEVIVLPVSDAAGHVAGMRGTMQDITARKALEDRLAAAKDAADATNRAKSAFLATMSHEIRTPLNGMLGLLELISLTPVNPEIHTALEAVRDSGQSLQRIIDDILDFSKVEAGKLQIFPEPTRVSDLIDSVHRIYSGSAKSLGLDFRQYIDPDLSPVLMLDALRLRQILSNFVSNAIKFTSSGSVELRVVSEGHDRDLECLRFEVVDTGIGISTEEQHMLFQEFEQAQNIASRFGGTGLGLSICRRLAELMGGNVSMSSELGVGTVMTLHLVAFVANPALAPPSSELRHAAPALLSEKVSRPAAHSLPEAPRLPAEAVHADSGALLLVVDDHPINRMVMRKQANTLGYAVEDVGSGAEAFEQWRSGKYSLVLTDLNMPGMSGYDLSRQIRQAEATDGDARIPIIACSANAIPGVREDCMDAGMDDYISKPIKLMELSEKLVRWLPSTTQHGDSSLLLPHADADATEQGHATAQESGARVGKGINESGITKQALAHFKQVNDVDVMQLLEAVEHSDMATVTRMAHRIKGACGFIGAKDMASVCGMMEQAARDEDSPGVAWLLDVFHIELEQLNATLDA